MALEKLGVNSKDRSGGQMHNTVTEEHVEKNAGTKLSVGKVASPNVTDDSDANQTAAKKAPVKRKRENGEKETRKKSKLEMKKLQTQA